MKKLFLIALILYIHSITYGQTLESGPAIGADCPAFDPQHVSGPDKGTHACPMCKYGYGQGVLIWWNTDTHENISRLTKKLDEEIEKKGLKRIRVFVVYMNPQLKSKEALKNMLTQFANANQLKKVAITYIPSPTDPETAELYSINPDKNVRNTVIVYKSRGAYAKYINFSADDSTIKDLIATVEKASREKTTSRDND